MRPSRWLFLLTLASFAISACQTPPPPDPRPDFRADATIREIMKSMVEPGANALWDAVAVTVSGSGAEEDAPKTDDDWEALRQHAVIMTEATNLLLIEGRHVAPPGAKSANPGSELEPADIETRINQSRQDWVMRANALHEKGLAALEAIDARDAEGLSSVGGDIDEACESCHLTFWYPNEKK